MFNNHPLTLARKMPENKTKNSFRTRGRGGPTITRKPFGVMLGGYFPCDGRKNSAKVG